MMAETYNEDVLRRSEEIRLDMTAIAKDIHAIQQFSLTDRDAYIARIRALGMKYGHDLSNWHGNDAPPPEPRE